MAKAEITIPLDIPDVRVLHLYLLYTDWYIGEVAREDPQFPLPTGWTLRERSKPLRSADFSWTMDATLDQATRPPVKRHTTG